MQSVHYVIKIGFDCKQSITSFSKLHHKSFIAFEKHFDNFIRSNSFYGRKELGE